MTLAQPTGLVEEEGCYGFRAAVIGKLEDGKEVRFVGTCNRKNCQGTIAALCQSRGLNLGIGT